MSSVAEVLAQEANRRSEEDFAEREKRKRKNYEYQLQQKNMAKAKEAQRALEPSAYMRLIDQSQEENDAKAAECARLARKWMIKDVGFHTLFPRGLTLLPPRRKKKVKDKETLETDRDFCRMVTRYDPDAVRQEALARPFELAQRSARLAVVLGSPA